jgi:hypothetical protein
VVQTSFNFCTAAFIFMMSCGFLTFGGASQGLILNNYAEQVRPFSLSFPSVPFACVCVRR